MKINYSYCIILILIFVIFIQRSFNNKTEKITSIVTVDTIYKIKQDTLIKVVNLISEKLVYPKNFITPSNNIDTCKIRFNELADDYYIKRVYSDTLKLDEIGNIVITDTVWQNKLHKQRKYLSDYKIPTVVKTIIEYEKPKRQLFVGGSLLGNSANVVNVIPSLLYKNRKDQIYQVSVGLNSNGQVNYGLGTYWKIKLRR
jgi:hypothetical protein